MAAKSGQCLCGAVRFTAENVEREFGACHCVMCQRWSGGPFFATSVKNLTFQSEENLTRFRSSEWAERAFCSVCGSNVYYRVLKSEGHEVCVGTFDDNHDLALNSEIFIDRKPGGYAIAGEHPRLTEAETLARYADYSG